jgi:hypothetical protein
MAQGNPMTKFSVIVPTFNSGLTLLATLDSIRKQKWPHVEVIIIDGSSRDNTVELVHSYKELTCILISEPDRGIYDAINKGIALATGDLICVIGSDDQLAENALSFVDNAWQRERSDIVAGGALLVSEDGASHRRVDEAYGIGALVSGIPFCHNSMFVTPNTYAKVGGYNLGYRICADAQWVHRAILASCSCVQIEEVLVKFSLTGASSSNDELIMNETYSVIVGNFPSLSKLEAEVIFKAVRGWSDGRAVPAILAKYDADEQLEAAVIAAFNAKHIKLTHMNATRSSAAEKVRGHRSWLLRAFRKLANFLNVKNLL